MSQSLCLDQGDILDVLANLVARRLESRGLIAERDPEARHGPDFRSIYWFGQHYQFSPIQSEIVRLL